MKITVMEIKIKLKIMMAVIISMVITVIPVICKQAAYASDNIRIIGESEEDISLEPNGDTGSIDLGYSLNAQGSEAVSDEATLDDEAVSDTSSGISDDDGSDNGESAAETEDLSDASDDYRPFNPSDTGTTSEEAVSAARALYSQMQYYADINANEEFADLFEEGSDAQTIQVQLQAIKSSLSEIEGLDSHADMCFFDPTEDNSQSPYYFAVALCDYNVDEQGAVSWYSTLIRVAQYQDGWKASMMSVGDLLKRLYPEGYLEAEQEQCNAVDLYPSLAMRFSSSAVFKGALYALPNMAWQDSDGEVCIALWVANGTQTVKWCDNIDIVLTDSALGEIVSVNLPVQTVMEGGVSSFMTCIVPADYVKTGTDEWTSVTAKSNMNYE